MKRCIWLLFLLVAYFLPVSGAWATPNEAEQLYNKNIDTFGCVYQRGDVIFHGYTGHFMPNDPHKDLVACVEDSHLRHIDHLYITSVGGDAWRTLQFVRAWAGRIDTIVVESLCASSCANYVLPIAKKLILKPHSFIVIHGSLDAKASIRAIYAAEPEAIKHLPKNVKISALKDSEVRAAHEAYHEEMVQAQFASTFLSCRRWLHPFDGVQHTNMAHAMGFIPQRAMVTRCLKNVRIAQFWQAKKSELPENLKEQQFEILR